MGCFCKKVRTLHCKVVLLDEQELVHEIQENSPGHEVLDTVFRHLNLLETAYFGLRYLDTANQPHWLDPTKKVSRELKGNNGSVSCTLYFGVKFYAADPCKLLEEITRYQFYLQVKQDILQGRLPVTFDLAAELGAYVVQSELGDYDPRRHSPGYVSEFRFVANQTAELECRIAELHKGLVGQLPADAEMAYLDRVKWLDMYGVDLHPVLGEDNVEYFLGLTPSGIIVLRNKNKVGNYYWPRISKIYFKGRYFMLRVCDKNNEENTYGFETPSRAACKQLWKCCVEHHGFFRLVRVTPAPNDIFRLSSRFRYSGRTEKQARSDVEAGRRVPPVFERSPSRRQQRRVVEGAAHSKWQTVQAGQSRHKLGNGNGQGRRVVEGASHSPNIEEIENRENVAPNEKQPVPVANNGGTETSNAPASVAGRRKPSPPLSTRSAPWAEPHARGLYTNNASPRSLRSAASTGRIVAHGHGRHHSNHSNSQHRRSSSVESHSSTDSRPCRRHKHHRSRRGSDSESEVSKCSERCHSRCRNRHHRHKSRHKSGNSGSRLELVDSTGQWREVQRRQAEGGPVAGRIQQATVISNVSRRSGYANSGADTETQAGDNPHGRHRRRLRTKHRSRSRSPSESKALPDELKRHLDFDLIDTEGMSEAQLREIPYTVVQTSSKPLRVKMSPGARRHHHSSRRSAKSHEEKGSTDRLSVNSQPVSQSRVAPTLPFSPSASSLVGSAIGIPTGTGSTHSLTPHLSKTAMLRTNSPQVVNNNSNNAPPLPRVSSALALNGNYNSSNNNIINSNHINNNTPETNFQNQHSQSIHSQQQHHTQQQNYFKSYQTGLPPIQLQHQQLQQKPPLQPNGPSKQNAINESLSKFISPHGSSEQLDLPSPPLYASPIHTVSTDGVTSFINGHAISMNRARVSGAGVSQAPPSPDGLGRQSPYGNRGWDEGKAAGTGSRASSGRGSSASSSSGFRRTNSCHTPPLPPIVTPHGVTIPNNINGCNLTWRQPPVHPQRVNLPVSSDRRTNTRKGPLFYQQQQHNIQQSNAVLKVSQFDNTNRQGVKTAALVQNAAYGSLRRNQALLNGNVPHHFDSCDGLQFSGRAPFHRAASDTGTHSETCTEL